VKTGAVESRVEIVADGHHGAQILLHQFRVLADCFRHGAEDDADLASSFLNVVTTDTLSNTASTATRAGLVDIVGAVRLAFRVDRRWLQRPANAGEDFLLLQRNAELGVGLQEFGVDLVERLRPSPKFFGAE